MVEQGTNSTMPNRAEIESTLAHVLQSPRFAASPQARLFLEYVVVQELKGQGSQTEAYSIAIDALGRPEDFDPSSDPAIRVLAKRVRNALEEYYAANPNAELVIELPVGSYRPRFREVQSRPPDRETGETPDQAVPITIGEDLDGQASTSPRSDRVMFVVATILILLLLGMAAWWPKSETSSTFTPTPETPVEAQTTASAPIVEILPFSSFDPEGDVLAEGLRQQLMFDLSRFPHLRIRDLDKAVSSQSTAYTLDGSLVRAGNSLRLYLTASEPNLRTIIWSKSFDAPGNDADYQQLLFDAVSGIASELGDINGVFATEIINELAHRVETHANAQTSDYQCVMLFYAFDQRKDQALQDKARDCLSKLVDSDSRDSTVWSSWAFLRFLDWTARSDSISSPMLADAEHAAQHAIDLDPDNAKAHEYLASIILAEGRIDEALASYARAFELNPSNLDVLVTIGWSKILQNDWDSGIAEIESAVAQALNPPGWYFIPLSANAFRTGKNVEALDYARTIVASGDDRGIVLALAAALRLNDQQAIAEYKQQFAKMPNADPHDPMRAVRNILNVPDVMSDYDRTLEAADLGSPI
ncbi:MAG: hypothetical protein H6874_03940 [Hyphomicrobiaceae bacterium]|nr:hypothetical protein [Hyphomicrobiaceae bacterium]